MVTRKYIPDGEDGLRPLALASLIDPRIERRCSYLNAGESVRGVVSTPAGPIAVWWSVSQRGEPIILRVSAPTRRAELFRQEMAWTSVRHGSVRVNVPTVVASMIALTGFLVFPLWAGVLSLIAALVMLVGFQIPWCEKSWVVPSALPDRIELDRLLMAVGVAASLARHPDARISSPASEVLLASAPAMVRKIASGDSLGHELVAFEEAASRLSSSATEVDMSSESDLRTYRSIDQFRSIGADSPEPTWANPDFSTIPEPLVDDKNPTAIPTHTPEELR